MQRRPAKGDDQRQVVAETLLPQLHEQGKALDRRILVEPEPPFREMVVEHQIEGTHAKIRALLVDQRRIAHLGAGLPRPGDAHTVEERMQDAEADIHAVDRHAGFDEPAHGDLDQLGERRVLNARCDDRGGDVWDVWQPGRVHGRGFLGAFGVLFKGNLPAVGLSTWLLRHAHEGGHPVTPTLDPSSPMPRVTGFRLSPE
jgi:hypothetical protein